MDEQERALLMDIHQRSIRIEERLTAVAVNQLDQENRIRLLEKWRNVLAGAVAVISSLFGYNTHSGI